MRTITGREGERNFCVAWGVDRAIVTAGGIGDGGSRRSGTFAVATCEYSGSAVACGVGGNVDTTTERAAGIA